VSNLFEKPWSQRKAPTPTNRVTEIRRELTANYRIDIGRNFSMLIAMTGAAQTRRGLEQTPTRSVNLFDRPLKTANVLPIRLIPQIEEIHGRN
jgi:GTP cyclohydrolase I